MAQSQMISKGISDTDAPENALYLGGNLNQTSYMEEGGLARDDSLLTAGGGLRDN